MLVRCVDRLKCGHLSCWNCGMWMILWFWLQWWKCYVGGCWWFLVRRSWWFLGRSCWWFFSEGLLVILSEGLLVILGGGLLVILSAGLLVILGEYSGWKRLGDLDGQGWVMSVGRKESVWCVFIRAVTAAWWRWVQILPDVFIITCRNCTSHASHQHVKMIQSTW